MTVEKMLGELAKDWDVQLWTDSDGNWNIKIRGEEGTFFYYTTSRAGHKASTLRSVVSRAYGGEPPDHKEP